MEHTAEERLEEIKERHNNSINSFVDGKDIDWLIERIEYLENIIKEWRETEGLD